MITAIVPGDATNKVLPIVGQIVGTYARDRIDFTIPNAAYNEGVRQIDAGLPEREGWDYHSIDLKRSKNDQIKAQYNPFK